MPPKPKQVKKKKKNEHDLWSAGWAFAISDDDFRKPLGELKQHMKAECAKVGHKYAGVSTDVGRQQVLALIERKAKEVKERRGHPGIDKIFDTLMAVKNIANAAAAANPIASVVVAALFMAVTARQQYFDETKARYMAIRNIVDVIILHANEDKAVQHRPDDAPNIRTTRDYLRQNYIFMYGNIIQTIAKVVHALYRKAPVQLFLDAFRWDGWEADLTTLEKNDKQCNKYLSSLDRLRRDPTIPSPAVERARNALHNAAANNQPKDVAALIRSGDYDINAKTKHSWTALSLAAEKGHVQVVRQFVHLPKMKLNSQNDKGQTALIVAVKKNKFRVVRALVEELINRKKKLDVKDESGKTALMYAVEGKHIEIEKIIKEAGKSTKEAGKAIKDGGNPTKDSGKAIKKGEKIVII